jgi:DnaJ like chaperone protein
MAMKWIGKIAGGLLGGLVLGPIGAAIGVLLGHQFDQQSEEPSPHATAEELAAIGERFFRATFRVMGYLAKADGRVSELEISAAREVMDALRLNAAQVREAIGCFTAGKQPQFDLDAELAELSAACRGRPDLARVFVEIQVRAALAGNDLGGPVRRLIPRIAAALSVSALELAHIEAVLRIQRGAFRAAGAAQGASAQARDLALEEAYRVLESSAAASDDEVAKAYRRQLHRHHPDKLKANGLPESMLAHAKQRTQQIIEAWELVRARRGLR